MSRTRAAALAVLVLMMMVCSHLARAFSTTTRHLPVNPARRRVSALSSQYSQPATSSSSTSSALFRRQNRPSASLRLPPQTLASQLRIRQRWSRQAITTFTKSQSSSEREAPTNFSVQLLERCRTAAQQLINFCNRPFSQVQQWSILLVFYFFHLLVLSQHSILFGWQLFPNNKGHFCSVGWDSVAGMISLAVWVYAKRGSTFFRKPWRRLFEDFPSPSDSESINQTATTLSDEAAAEKKALNAIVSTVLKKAPQKMLLKRSSPSTRPKNESLESLDLISRGKSSVSPSSTNTTASVASANVTSENNRAATFPDPSTSIPTTKPQSTPEATETNTTVDIPTPTTSPEKPTPQVTLRKEDIIIESSRINGTEKSKSSSTASTRRTDTNTTSTSITFTNTTSTDAVNDASSSLSAAEHIQADETVKYRPSSSSAASKPSMYFTFDDLSERFNSFNKGCQQQFKKIAVVPDESSNATRIEKQGPDLSAVSLPPPAQRRYMLTRGTSIIACLLLVQTYFATGRFSFFWEDTLYAMAGVGFPLTVAMHRSLCVLLGHLTWVAAGSAILRVIVRPKFFGRNNKWYRQNAGRGLLEKEKDVASLANSIGSAQGKTPSSPRRRNNNWIWWVIGGYSVSAWFFNVADFANLYALPAQVLEDAIMQEGVVTQLINPENNDFLASLVGYIAPCLSAPWWEEILYRGFFFPALSLFVPVWASVLISGIVFSAHHLSLTAALPLAVLGWTWSGLYMASDNLWTTILVHALWNTRVFLSSWLGV